MVGVSIHAGRDVDTGDINVSSHQAAPPPDIGAVVAQARALLVEEQISLAGRRYAEDRLADFEREANKKEPDKTTLDRIVEQLARITPAVAKVLATLVPAVMQGLQG